MYNNIEYKDADPKDTIETIKNILENVGINVYLKTKKNNNFNVYHTEVSFNGNSVYLGGKGSTADYSEASALGEIIERLQSRCWWYDESNALCSDYKWFPDEAKFLLEDYDNLPNEFIEDIYTHFTKYSSIKLSKIDVKNICFSMFNNIRSVPFYNYKTKDITYIPFDILRDFVGTNGLASGNTIEEATVQAICELFERYCMIQIVTNKLTPPEIPLQYVITHYPKFKDLLQKLVSCNYELRVFDASLGLDLPVLCVIFIDKSSKKYNIKFGSHPVFSIALDRCITEMFECYESVDSFIEEKCHHILESNDISYNSFKNYNLLVCSNKNIVDNSFFSLKSSWEFKEWKLFKNYNNNDGCKDLINLAVKNFNNLYIRNNGFLGFPTIHVYIPSISFCKFIPYDIRIKYNKIMGNCINFPNFDLYDKKILSDMIEFLENDISFYHRESKHNVNGEQIIISDETIISLLYFRLGELKKAFSVLNKKIFKTEFDESLLIRFQMMIDNCDESDIRRVISLFSTYEISKIVNSDNIIKTIFNVHTLKPFNVYNLINKLKLEMKNNYINQHIFENLCYGTIK